MLSRRDYLAALFDGVPSSNTVSPADGSRRAQIQSAWNANTATFDPTQPYQYGGSTWNFDTPQARQQAATTAANTENGQSSYDLGYSGFDPSVLKSIGYTGPSVNVGDYAGLNGPNGNDVQSQQQYDAARQQLSNYLDSKGYTLGTSYLDDQRHGVLGTGSTKVQQFFDANGNPVGDQQQVGGDTGWQMLAPIAMAGGAALISGGAAGAGAGEAGASADATAGASGSGLSGGWGTSAVDGTPVAVNGAAEAGQMGGTFDGYTGYGANGTGIPSSVNLANAGGTMSTGPAPRPGQFQMQNGFRPQWNQLEPVLPRTPPPTFTMPFRSIVKPTRNQMLARALMGDSEA